MSGHKEESLARVFVTSFVTAVVATLILGAVLMWLIPIASPVFGLELEPGYHECVALLIVSRILFKNSDAD